jgi:hypothetical protein
VSRNVLAAATPYFNAMFTSGLIESEYEERQIRRQVLLQVASGLTCI